MSKENPLSKSDKESKRVEPELESDKFSVKESKKIVEIVLADQEIGYEAQKEWVEQRKLDLMHYYGEKPSKLENLTKKSWQSDRNLGLCAAVCDAYQATLLATCYNPDTIHFVATEDNDINNKENLEKFSKWALGPTEGNFFPEVDDYIHNKVTQGTSYFKIFWKVWYEWVDKRIPKKTGGYTIKTEKMRFEKGIIENISDIDDILLPSYGKNIQDLDFFIQIIHKSAHDLIDEGERKVFNNVDEKFVDKLKGVVLDELKTKLGKVKAEQLGLKTPENLSEKDIRSFPCDLVEWYGYYKKNGKNEKYRFIVEPYTKTLLSGKPLRKISRTGKIPFVGGPLIRRPGQVRGRSLPDLISSVINAFNNSYNQKSDFQHVENCPYGFYNPNEEFGKNKYDLLPGVLYPTDGKPQDNVYFPSFQRSMAWAESDFKIQLEILERLTGAAAYFMSNQKGVSGTATRDNIINEKSETRFGLWVRRIQSELAEAITMYINMYQDWMPPKLGKRVLGEKEGKKVFHNLSIDSLRGNYDARLSPDIISGSKSLEKQVLMWAFENMPNVMWLNPQVNPKGNYELTADVFKKILGIQNVEKYLGKQPPTDPSQGEDIENEWTRLAQGEVIDPPEGETGMAMAHLIGHTKKMQECIHEVDEEYRQNIQDHIFKTSINVRKFMMNMQKEKMANALASEMVMNKEVTGQEPVL